VPLNLEMDVLLLSQWKSLTDVIVNYNIEL